MLRLEALRMRPDEIAAALDLTLSDIISWLAGETNSEQSDVLEVGLAPPAHHQQIARRRAQVA